MFPHEVGTLDDDVIVSNIGRYGPYLSYRGENFRLPKTIDPLTITLDEAKGLIAKGSSTTKTRGRKKKES